MCVIDLEWVVHEFRVTQNIYSGIWWDKKKKLKEIATLVHFSWGRRRWDHIGVWKFMGILCMVGFFRVSQHGSCGQKHFLHLNTYFLKYLITISSIKKENEYK